MRHFIIGLSVLGLLACKRSGNEAEQVHEHGPLEEKHTLFADGMEFYIEHEALVAGEEGEFLLHITDLRDYSPLGEGLLTLEIDGKSAHIHSSETLGIYHAHFTPARAGVFDLKATVESDGQVQTCTGHVHIFPTRSAMHEAQHQGHGHSDSEKGEISFMKEQAWASDFMVEEVTPGPFHTVIPTSGELMPLPGEKKNIHSTTRGMVHFTNPQLVQGVRVEKGQELFIISSEALLDNQLQLRFESARNRLEKSRSEFQRHRKLYHVEAISERQYLESRSMYVEDSLNYHAMEEHVTDEGIHIQAPASGSLHELLVSDGMYVSEGDKLAVLSPDRKLMLRADLPQQFFPHSQDIYSATFRPAYSNEVFTVEELHGHLLAIGHSVKENNHYLPVNFFLENQGKLLEGAFAEVYLLAGLREQVLSIPVSALGEEQGGKYVYVQLDGESYIKRQILQGPGDGRRVEILSGLEAGDRIVTRGQMLVKAASMDAGEFGHGHTH